MLLRLRYSKESFTILKMELLLLSNLRNSCKINLLVFKDQKEKDLVELLYQKILGLDKTTIEQKIWKLKKEL